MYEWIYCWYYFHLIQAWNVLQLVMTTMFVVPVLQIWPETGKNVTNLLGISWPNFVITVKPIHVLTNLYVKVIYWRVLTTVQVWLHCSKVEKKNLKVVWIWSLHLQWKFKLWAGKFPWGVKAKHCTQGLIEILGFMVIFDENQGVSHLSKCEFHWTIYAKIIKFLVIWHHFDCFV